MKRYLITGGKGYIGENMADFIEAEGDMFSMCDYHTDLPAAHKLTHDILKSYDGVIHLAALSGIFACEEDPWRAMMDNVVTAGNVFSIATELGIPVVFTSSQAAKTPHTSLYANIKWTCETLANHFNQHGGRIYVVRLANCYGGYKYLKKKNTVVKQLITMYQIKRPFAIHGNGKQVRDFVDVLDVCEAIYKIMNNKPDYFEPIDIGTGIGKSILDVRNMFPSHPCEFIDSRSVGVDSNVADTTVLEKLTGFVPKRELEDYIKEMI